MHKISLKEQKILGFFLEKEHLPSSAVYSELIKQREKTSLITVKRTLSDMATAGFLTIAGSGRSTSYRISILGRIHADVDAAAYCKTEPDKRYGMARFNFDLLRNFPKDIFLNDESEMLKEATKEYHRRTADLSETIQKKELERLIIELSWKSSKIEGNTYTLLDTERLILEHKEAPGHSKNEAHMILNHRDAFTFVHRHAREFKKLTRANLEHLHAILVKNLGVGKGLRKKPMGVLGSKYHPLDNVHQINDATENLSRAIAKMKSPYAKAFVALLGISYIQPFEDGNKRTSRLMANALLLSHQCAPLSYRSVDENEYREAIMVFYELNSAVAFRKIFVAQYDFAARNYAVK